jgi:hypothetical protein
MNLLTEAEPYTCKRRRTLPSRENSPAKRHCLRCGCHSLAAECGAVT